MPSDPEDDKGSPESGPIPAPVDAEVAAKTAAPEISVATGVPTAQSGDAASVDSIEISTGVAKPGESGSIDVALSGQIPKPPVLPDGVVIETANPADSAPVSSGRITSMTAAATGPTESPRSKRITDVGKSMLGLGVSSIGTGIETIGEGVSRLGEASKKVPMVGASVARLGEGVTKLGESITGLPAAARTRRGALLVRSLLVGFILVFSWIAIIVMLQLQATDSPDFRPHAERILRQITRNQPAIATLEKRLESTKLSPQERKVFEDRRDALKQERVRDIEDLYEKASPRFQEMVRKERFVDEMLDLNKTCGQFLEITAVNESFVSSGPTGRIGRMSTIVQYAHGKTRAAVSLHLVDGEWKLLGVSVEVPPELAITPEAREERVTPCDAKGPDGKADTSDDIPNGTMNTKQCDIHAVANRILEELRDGQAAVVWEAANRDVFQKQEVKTHFIEIQAEQQRVLGEYRRIIAVTEAKVFSSKEEERAFFDVIAEYSRANVRVIFGFTRPSKTLEWQLRSLKIALPMPRIDDLARTAGSDAPSTGSGLGSGSAGSGSQKPAVGSGSQAAGSQRPPQRPPQRPNSPATGSGSSRSGSATTGSGSSGSGSGS